MLASLTWAPIPLSHSMRGILGLYHHPAWHQGQLIRLRATPCRAGYLWIGPRGSVLRWRGVNYRLAPAQNPWPDVDRIIRQRG